MAAISFRICGSSFRKSAGEKTSATAGKNAKVSVATGEKYPFTLGVAVFSDIFLPEHPWICLGIIWTCPALLSIPQLPRKRPASPPGGLGAVAAV